MKTPTDLAREVFDEHHSQLALAAENEILAMIASAVDRDRDQRGLVEAVAEVLDDRGATTAAQLVRDTDPDDDLWNNYLGPMLDDLEADYTKIAHEQGL